MGIAILSWLSMLINITLGIPEWIPDDLVDGKPGSGLVPPGNKPLPEPVLTKISDAIWRHQATMTCGFT